MEPSQLKVSVEELAALVRAARGGDDHALSRLISATQEKLFRFLLFLTGDTALARDLCQDTYLHMCSSLRKLEDPKAFLKWLYLIAKNRFLDHRKSSANRLHSPEPLDGLAAAATAEQRELVLQVRQGLQALDPDDRLLLVLVDMEGYSYAEAADFLRISEAALTSRLRRARAAFHEKFHAK